MPFCIAFGAMLLAMLGAMSAQAQLFWNTNGTVASWTASNWGSSGSGPFTTAWTNNSNTRFTANSSVNWVTNTQIGNITVDTGVTVTLSPTGTLSTNGNVRTIDIGSGGTLDFASQTVSTGGGTGFIKAGAGTWNIGNMGSGAAPGGFTLNAGIVITSGNNGLGNGVLTLNGGTWESSGARDYNPSSMTIGGDFALTGTGNAILSKAAGGIGLGSSTRTITNSAASGSRQFTGAISGGAGAGLTFAGSGGAQIYIGNTGNSFTGPIAINGGEVVFNDNGSLGSTTSITLDGGRLTMASMASDGTTSALTSATIGTSKNIFVGASAGTSISVSGGTGVTTYNGVIADKTSTTGSWAKQGAGKLVLGGVSTFSGNLAINNGTVQLTTGNDRLPTGTSLNLGQAASSNLGTLDLNGRSQQVAGLNSVGGTSASGDNTVTSSTSATLTLGGSGTYSYGDGTNANSGVITGAITLIKTGTGSQTLGDANTFTGGTTLTAGTLVAGNNSALGSTGAQTVTFNGGKLASNNDARSLANNLTVNNVAGNQIAGANSVTLTGTAGGSGTLEIALTDTSKSVTVNPGTANSFAVDTMSLTSGTLLLGASNRLGNATNLRLNGGILDLDNFSEGTPGTDGLGALILSASSTLDYGTLGGGSNLVEFANAGAHTAGTNLLVTNYDSGSDHLYFGGVIGDFFSAYAQNEVSFNGASGYSALSFGSYYEIVPIPEPATILCGLALLGFIACRERHRLGAVQIRRALPAIRRDF